MMFKTYFEGN